MLRFIFPPRYVSRAVAFALLAGLCCALFWPHSSHAGFQTTTTPQISNWTIANDNDIFVLYKNERGETRCRPATRAEREQINSRNLGGQTRVIYPGAPRKFDKPTGHQTLDSSNLLPSAGLRIVLHGTTQLEQNQTARNAFIAAANGWEAIVSTPITVVIDVDFGPTFFGQPYDDPDILGQTLSSLLTGPYSDLRQRLINGASNSAETELYNALPPTELPTEVNDVVSSVTSARATAANARALGIIPDITNPDSLTLGQGDAGIGFNSAFPFDFNPDDGISSGLTDFDAVAVHEIGHALGFTSNAGRNLQQVAVWDLFRFKPARASLATFGTTPRILSIGGDQVFFGNQVTTYATLELALSTGGPDPDENDGDGRQSSHWRDDDLISTTQYIGIMDPTMDDGLRRTISENDILALDLFGYSIGGPARVRPVNDNFANAIALNTGAGSVSGTNVNATREAGEPTHVGLLGDKSVWYSWVSTVNGQATFDTTGSNFDTTLAVYTGTTVNQLINLAQSDDIIAGVNKVSRVQFNVTSGQTYRIVVDGWNSEFGNITLNWTSAGVTPTPTPSPSPIPTPSPTPTPPADLVIDSFVASPDPVATTQFVNFVVAARNGGPGPATNTQISVALPSGASFVSCLPSCSPPPGADGGSASTTFVNVFPNSTVSFTVSAKVTAESGAMLSATANISSAIQDPNPANNSASATVRVVDLIPFTEVKKVALDPEGNHVLALRRGTVWAWGHNFFGQLGDGTNVSRTTPVPVDDLMSVVDIGAGNNYSIALKSDGTVWTWGNNNQGLLGTGAPTSTSVNRPVRVSSLSSVTAIAAGTGHVLALKDGTVWVWGSNSLGELGLGTADFAPHATPAQIPGLTGIVTIFAGDHVSYAVKADGTVFGWGAAFFGKVGDGTAGFSINSPKELPALKGMIDIASGVASTVTMRPDGSVLSFGTNFRGQLGRGLPDDGPYPVPTEIPGLVVKEVSNGDSFIIVTEPSGALKAFGRNDSGQLGLGSADLSPHATPVSVPGISGVFATTAGRDSVLALIGDPATGGSIRSWGGNAFGVLGTGSNSPSLNPAVVVENLTVARPNFSVAEGTITATQVQIVCGTPGSVIHYTTNGSDPTENDPVVASGGTVTVDQSLTLKARAFRSGFATSAIKSAAYTVVAPLPLQLLLDQTGPVLDQAAALDLLTLVRDPFPVINANNLLNLSTDKNTRVIVFVRNLQLSQGEQASAVVVNLVGSNDQTYDIPAEDVRSLSGSEFVQVTFRLPDTLAVGTCTIRIKAHAQVSNAGTIRIQP